jgi:hypothetical protein
LHYGHSAVLLQQRADGLVGNRVERDDERWCCGEQERADGGKAARDHLRVARYQLNARGDEGCAHTQARCWRSRATYMDEEATRRRARKAAYEEVKAQPPARKSFTPEELKTCMRVLNIVAQQDDESDAPPEVEEVRQQLAAIAKAAHRRNRRKERGASAGEAAARRPPQPATPPPTTEATEEGVVCVPAAFLSRPLYPNPVCLLASRRPRGGAVNLMTISWLTAVDNAGGFVCSMNQSRHTASLLATNRVFTLSVPVVGMEDLVRLRVRVRTW